MKKIFALLLLSNIAFAQAQNVSILCTETFNYCGGAPPSEEILARLSTPSPQANFTYYIVKGKKQTTKVFKKVTTDDSGLIKIKLPPGTYALLKESQIKDFKEQPNTKDYDWDQDCLRKKHKTPVLIFTVGKLRSFKVNTHQPCFYQLECGDYKGYLPA